LKYPRSSLKYIAVATIYHEIAHQYGFDEKHAVKFENYIREKHEISKALLIVDPLQWNLKDQVSSSDGEKIARIYEMKGELFSLINGSILSERFMLANMWNNDADIQKIADIYFPKNPPLWVRDTLAPGGSLNRFSAEPVLLSDDGIFSRRWDEKITLDDKINTLRKIVNFIQYRLME